MSVYDSLPEAVTEIFGADAGAERSYDLLTVDVPATGWISALETARDTLGCTYFDWLSAVDEPGTGFRVSAHVVSLEGRTVRRLLVRTTVPHSAPALPTAMGVYAGAAWHERETHEMFGIDFTDHPHLAPLLLPDTFEGHPLRKDFVLAARVAKAWPGAKEPGESAAAHGGPKRRQMLPPGVPDPNEWGPLKGRLPAAPSRPARGARTAGTTAAGSTAAGSTADRAAAPGAAERPPRRSRSVSEGSASQAAQSAPTSSPEAATPPRRSRSVSEGSASQAAQPAPTSSPEAATPPRRSRSASEGSASQTAGAAGAGAAGAAGTAGAAGAAGAAEEAAAEAAKAAAAAEAAEAAEAARAAEAAPPARSAAGSPPRRSRSASEGSASQAAAGARPEPPAPAADAAPKGPDGPAEAPAPPGDAPWHQARPAFDEPAPDPVPATEPASEPVPATELTPDPAPSTEPDPDDDTPTHPAGGDTA
ncbi:NADH-quinone oxidoreductase subunit C [Streptomyces sp. NPDC091272]|uniref:NADH-quinone oxidoreductase subunit C n=1 Tax=Streptomyces sp. NPDC091272 TaxID=3365981 RepID=UPI00380B2B58